MDHIQLFCNIKSNNLPLARDIVMDELAEMGFESFEELPNGLIAYIAEINFIKKSLLNHVFLADYDLGTVDISYVTIKDQNWNKEWENNFQPVLIAGKCYIRAPFHKKSTDIQYDIIIEPKMAFGTGHHETTSLMIEMMFSLGFENKKVLDMGCGTGILGIMAAKLKANQILSIDIDEWAYHNTLENAAANDVHNISAEQGGVEKILGKSFDIVLANINRNILLNQIPAYAKSLPIGGLLLMSGIYEHDFETIQEAAEDNHFIFRQKNIKNDWIAVLFCKG
jgi:ribosomal protein L11 methyltransferase